MNPSLQVTGLKEPLPLPASLPPAMLLLPSSLPMLPSKSSSSCTGKSYAEDAPRWARIEHKLCTVHAGAPV